MGENPLVTLIGACEVGFWVLLGAGLVARYALRWRRVGAALLIGSPVLDVVLLVATVIDLRRGGEAGTAHALGATYLGFTVTFGHSVVRWADVRVAHRFAGGPPPVKLPKAGPVRVAHEWREWGKCVLACGIAAVLILFLSFVVGTPEQTELLWRDWLPNLGYLTGLWFLFGPVWSLTAREGARA
ncbi:hypothetical protein [Actinokineospora sp. NPDC004072]